MLGKPVPDTGYSMTELKPDKLFTGRVRQSEVIISKNKQTQKYPHH